MDGPTFTTPPGWTPVDFAPPMLGTSSGFSVDDWHAWRAPGAGDGRSVVGCFGVPLETWTDEATSLALERLDASLGVVAERLQHGLVLRRQGDEARTSTMVSERLRDAAAPDDTADVIARTFLGFVQKRDGLHLEACFAVCAPTTVDCVASLATTTPPPFVSRPPATIFVRSAVYGVHHPRAVAGAAVALFLCLGVLAVWTRPRPRRK